MVHQPASRPLDGAPFLKLIVSLLIDLVGYSTYIVPVVGGARFGWGPISVWYLYGNAWMAGIGLVEELLPSRLHSNLHDRWLLENRSSTPPPPPRFWSFRPASRRASKTNLTMYILIIRRFSIRRVIM